MLHYFLHIQKNDGTLEKAYAVAESTESMIELVNKQALKTPEEELDHTLKYWRLLTVDEFEEQSKDGTIYE